MPTTCGQAGANCGSISDGCGGNLPCGTCTAPQTCGGGGNANVCAVGTCVPKTCVELMKNCGAVPDRCAATLNCGVCGGGQVCGASNVCVSTCVPKTCVELGARCGTPPDGCLGTLSCGACSGAQTCGGGGTAYTCGAVCSTACPGGYTCDTQGVCSGGSAGNITRNVVQAPQVTVSGVVTLNGGQPTSTCSSSNRATITFRSLTNSNYDTAIAVPCNGGTTALTWSGLLYPSTYEVSVTGGLSNLPGWRVVVVDALQVP